MALEQLESEENLGVIVMKHESGIRETDQGHKFMSGNIGDTIMRGTDRKCYIAVKEEKKEKNSSSSETAAQKRAREAIENKGQKIIDDASATAKKIIDDAQAQAQKIIDDAAKLSIADPGVLSGTGGELGGNDDTAKGGEA